MKACAASHNCPGFERILHSLQRSIHINNIKVTDKNKCDGTNHDGNIRNGMKIRNKQYGL